MDRGNPIFPVAVHVLTFFQTHEGYMSTYSELPPDTPRNRGDYTAPHMSPVTPAEDARTILLNRVSWGAVSAGVVVALAVQIVLNLFGIGVGAAAIDPLKGDSPSGIALSAGAVIWGIVAGIIAAFVGGFAAGRAAGETKETTAGWHGLTSWAASLVVIALMVTIGAGKVVGGALNTAGVTAGSYAGMSQQRGVPPGAAVREDVRRATGANPDTAADAATAAMGSIMTGDPVQADYARERAAQSLSQSRGITMEQARTEIRNDEIRYRQAADAAAKNISRGSLLAAFALVLGALAAWAGGRLGTVKPTVTSARLRAEQLH
jgi:hypothetical protein